jgi:hypothetical protein
MRFEGLDNFGNETTNIIYPEFSSFTEIDFGLIYDVPYSLLQTRLGEMKEKLYWVDMDNRLWFNLTPKYNFINEYIKAEFTVIPKTIQDVRAVIPREATTNGNCTFYAGITLENGSMLTYDLNGTYQNEPSEYLPQGQYFDTLTLYISDNNDNANSWTEGYIEYFKLIDPLWLEANLETTTLLVALPVLIILIIPSFLLYRKFGAVIIFPMLILMSVVCFATELIPLWLFFILMVFFLAGIYFTSKYENEGFEVNGV